MSVYYCDEPGHAEMAARIAELEARVKELEVERDAALKLANELADRRWFGNEKKP